ncbi:DM13 domain-containing protein [Marininema halotolerans]|uniref:Electron transfer DM13 n=1 Tax=Marininema halotolerans TaxID=1155944 RepID=A0A1I6PPD8_9BACL|nr:DM13 domain-containing protein [Marininema halotolerans]SFS42061.1 Electron transfer DM13 [Marininema halotolerans]
MKTKVGLLVLMLTFSGVMAACGNDTDMSNADAKKSTKTEMTSKMENSKDEDMEMKKDEDMEMKSESSMMTGEFHGKNKKMVSGMVKFSKDQLMLSDFKTSKGPDLHVYLTKGGDVSMGKSLGAVDLKMDEQSFSLKGMNPDDYDTVVIYCDKAHVSFGEAKLM